MVLERRKTIDGSLFLQSTRSHLVEVKEEDEGRTPTFWRQLHGPIIDLGTINLISDDDNGEHHAFWIPMYYAQGLVYLSNLCTTL